MVVFSRSKATRKLTRPDSAARIQDWRGVPVASKPLFPASFGAKPLVHQDQVGFEALGHGNRSPLPGIEIGCRRIISLAGSGDLQPRRRLERPIADDGWCAGMAEFVIDGGGNVDLAEQPGQQVDLANLAQISDGTVVCNN